jgi:GR25 family glycosyltransferase involved in LPS biosynthesis
MKDVFNDLSFDYQVVAEWDADLLPQVLPGSEDWTNRLSTIKSILLANSIGKNYSSYEEALKHAESIKEVPAWMHPRCLKIGEVSVLLKHFTALLKISYGKHDYGIVFEDDIYLDSRSRIELNKALLSFTLLNGAYLDIAGGAGLHASPEFNPSNNNLYLCNPARTRTNACYCISRNTAITFVKNFFPLVFPIDWHLQYIMLNTKLENCFWTIRPPLIHGSEAGLVTSWRE